MTPDPAPAPVPLTATSLARLDRAVKVPLYDRSLLFPGLVHIGVGGFNRSHLAVYLDDLLQAGDAPRWGEFGVGLLPSDRNTHSALAHQDFLYSLLERDSDHQTLRVVGSLVGHLYAPDSPEAVLESLSSPQTRIVSMTVTEGGYFIDDSSKAFLDRHPDIQRDLKNPRAPGTWVGYLAEAADRRRKAGHAPFTVLSCDNLAGNGEAARYALSSFAALRDSALRRWIETNVAFPNSMVDRITPRTTPEDKALIAAQYGIDDLSPVVAEPFRQWVLEDTFAADRPSWEHAGAQMTADVRPYETMKMRLLNGGHSAIGYPAALLGFTYVADAANDPSLNRLLTAYLQEVRPLILPLPGVHIDDYAATVVRRFANETIKDQVSRICAGGVAKITGFILPSIFSLLAQRKNIPVLSFVIASWLHYMRGMDERGQTLEIVDASASVFQPFCVQGANDAQLALSVHSVFGDLAHAHPGFVHSVQQCLAELRTFGTREAIRRVLSRSNSA